MERHFRESAGENRMDCPPSVTGKEDRKEVGTLMTSERKFMLWFSLCALSLVLAVVVGFLGGPRWAVGPLVFLALAAWIGMMNNAHAETPARPAQPAARPAPAKANPLPDGGASAEQVPHPQPAAEKAKGAKEPDEPSKTIKEASTHP